MVSKKKKALEAIKLVLTILLIVGFIGLAIAYLFFGDKIEAKLGKSVDDIFYAVSTGVIAVAGGFSLVFKRLGKAISAVVSTNDNASKAFTRSSDCFNELSKEMTSLRGEVIDEKKEIQLTRDEIIKERQELYALACSIKALVKKGALLVCDGTAADVCATINEGFKENRDENESKNSAT